MRASRFLFDSFRKPQLLFFSVFTAASFILELLSYIVSRTQASVNVPSIITSRIWFTGIILFFISFIGIVVVQIMEDYRNKKYLLPLIFTVILAFFIFQIGNYAFSDLSYESTQETVSGLNAFKALDWNYTGKGYIGYPVKQYMINAFPSLILGRSFFALNLGFAIPFLTGLTLLFIELRKFLAYIGTDERYAILPILMISFCPYIDEYYYIFEQTLTPVAIAMILIALFLRTMRRPSLFSFMLFAITGSMLPFVYTPALAFMGLFTVILFYHAFMVFRGRSVYSKRRQSDINYQVAVGITAVLPILNFVCTLISKREDEFVTTYKEGFSAETLKNYFVSFARFFTTGDSLFFGVFGAIVLIYMLASLTMRIKFHNLMIALWCIGTALFSFMLPGAAAKFNFNYDPNVLAQRNMVIIPVVSVACLLAVADFLAKHEISFRKDALAVVSAAFILYGVSSLFAVHKAFTMNNYNQTMKYLMKYCQEVTEYHDVAYDDEFCLVIHTDNNLYSHPDDYIRYFFPNIKLYVFKAEDFGGIGINDAIFPRFVFSESEKTKDFYSTPFNSRSFNDVRFNTEYSLYFQYKEPDYSYVSFYDDDYIARYDLGAYVTEPT